MKLEEFVKIGVESVIKGMNDAQLSGYKVSGLGWSPHGPGVEFDVAVAYSAEENIIVAPKQKEQSDTSTSRIKFTVFVTKE